MTGMSQETELYKIAKDAWPRIPFRSPLEPLTEDQILLRKQVFHQIESEPGVLDMGTWECFAPSYSACKTTRCLAGWAVHLGGIDPRTFSKVAPVPLNFDHHGLTHNQWEALGVLLMGLTKAEYEGEAGETELFFCNDENATERMRKLADVQLPS